MGEQRNSYKGAPIRPWLRLSFLGRDGTTHSVELLADTGSPSGVILSPELFDQLVVCFTRAVNTNFGPMQGGWVRLYSRDLGLVEFVEGFRSEQAAQTAARSHPDFAGMVGLSVLRLAEYGGDSNSFWIRTPS
jgi:hypothetical protein